MNLQTQLLKIIEDQQKQLELQQKEQAKALELILTQSTAIKELQELITTLKAENIAILETIEKQKKINKQLSEQTISATFSETLQADLQAQLDSRLKELLENLDLVTEVKEIIKTELPPLAELELENQTTELANQIKRKLDLVSNFQEKLKDLTEELSTKL